MRRAVMVMTNLSTPVHLKQTLGLILSVSGRRMDLVTTPMLSMMMAV